MTSSVDQAVRLVLAALRGAAGRLLLRLAERLLLQSMR
jgi:hypothetical protein